nr:MAG TPA: hypothetical protein [Caudoviricetes sp.]
MFFRLSAFAFFIFISSCLSAVFNFLNFFCKKICSMRCSTF